MMRVLVLLLVFLVGCDGYKEAKVTIEKPANTQQYSIVKIEITVDGKVLLDQQEVKLENLSKALDEDLKQLKAKHGKNIQQELVIYASSSSRAGMTIDVLDIAKSKGIKKISIAAKEE